MSKQEQTLQIKKIKIGDKTYDIVVEKNWAQEDPTKADYIANKPIIYPVDNNTLKIVTIDEVDKMSVNTDSLANLFANLFAEKEHGHPVDQITDFPTIPTKVSELDNDEKYVRESELPQSGASVAWEQEVTAGTKIATITINETSTDVFVPEVTPIQLIHWDEETE